MRHGYLVAVLIDDDEFKVWMTDIPEVGEVIFFENNGAEYKVIKSFKVCHEIETGATPTPSWHSHYLELETYEEKEIQQGVEE